MNKMDLSNAQHRRDFANELGKRCPDLNDDKTKEQLKDGMMQEARKRLAMADNRAITQGQEEPVRPLEQSAAAFNKTPKELLKKAEAFLKSPDLIDRILADIHVIGVAGEQELSLMGYLIGTSRLLTRPLAGMVMGSSSSGKSYVLRKVADLLPAEATLRTHRMSPQALLYMENGSLVHRFVAAGERSRRQDDGAADMNRNWREMISDGKLSADIPFRSPDGVYETRHIEQDGPIAYVESTTLSLSRIDSEDQNRFILLGTDESAAQTDAILNEMAAAAASPLASDKHKGIIDLHHTAQRMLQPAAVIVPYAKKLIGAMPRRQLQVRRSFGHLLNLIKAVALLHQFQRERNGQGAVIATPDDYRIVQERLGGILQRGMGSELDPQTVQLFTVIQTNCEGEFTVAQVAGLTDYCETTVRKRIDELKVARQIICKAEQRGPQPATYAVADNRPALGGVNLPPVTEIVAANTDINAVAGPTLKAVPAEAAPEEEGEEEEPKTLP